MSTLKVTVIPNWDITMLGGLQKGLLEMTLDIDKRSAILAPKASRALVNDRKIKAIGSYAYTITYGSAKTPYARLRHYENKKNPQTIGYLAKAGDAVARGDKTKYFRGKV